MILSSDISVIVQGNINKAYTKICLQQIRKILPKAQIILSTWKNSEIEDLEYDVLILNEDPGASVINFKNNTLNNVNRQLLSTKAALRKTNRKFILKTRTDIYYNDFSFLKLYEQYDYECFNILSHPLLIVNFYTRNPRVLSIPFHPSDWILFGYSDDVQKYYSCTNLQNKEDMEYFLYHKNRSPYFVNVISRFFPEQYLAISFFKKVISIKCENFYDNSLENVNLSEKLFAKFFIVLDYKKQVNMQFMKYNPNRFFEETTILNYNMWIILREHYLLEKHTVQHKIKWLKYLGECMIFKMFNFYIRRPFVLFLDDLGLKNWMKNLLIKIER